MQQAGSARIAATVVAAAAAAGAVALRGGTATAGARAVDPLDLAPFTATPTQLLELARRAPAVDAPIHVLRDDSELRVDDAGRITSTYRTVAVVSGPAGVDDWGTFQLAWSPFYQDKPVVRARVIAPDGTVAELDPSLMTDAPSVAESPSVFSDRRTLSVPLPRLVVGAVIEEQIVVADREPLSRAGEVSQEWVTRTLPVESVRATFSAPAARPMHVVERGFKTAPRPSKTTANGRTTWSYALGPFAAEAHTYGAVPADVTARPYLGIATGASWAAVAADYRALVEAKLAEPVALPAGVTGATPRETVDRISAWLHEHVRYTGIELADSALVPAAPKETLARGFGDCKDQAALLIALLRAAGVHADLALLSDGFDTDVDRDLPGLGDFDHAIVRAEVDGAPLWIDATEDQLPAGQLPARDQGRRALVIAAGTKDLVAIPQAPAQDNLIREVRTYHLAEDDRGTITEVSDERGTFWGDLRGLARASSRADTDQRLRTYVDHHYHGQLVRFSDNAPAAITQPYQLTLEIADSPRSYTSYEQAEVWLSPSQVLSELPESLDEDDAEHDAAVAARTVDYAFPSPHVYEIENRIVLPPGYVAPALVAREDRAIGTMQLAITRKVDGDVVVITYRLDTGKLRLTPAELVATRAAVKAMRAGPLEHVVLPSAGHQLQADGKTLEAIAEYQRLIALHPKEAIHRDNLARIYREVGQGAAARRLAREATTVEPTSATAWSVLAYQLRRDTLGHEYGFDADRKGAIAAYRKALALDPKHYGALSGLASLLDVDERGAPNPSVREREEAAALWKRVFERAPDEHGDVNAVASLLAAGKLDEAAAAAQALPESVAGGGVRLAVAAMARGAAGAHEVAQAVRAGDHDAVVRDAMQRLASLRAYDALRAVYAELPAAGHNATSDRILARVTALDLAHADAADPRVPVELAAAAIAGVPVGIKAWDPAIDALIEASAHDVSRSPYNATRGRSPAMVRDSLLAAVELTVDGDAAHGWRVTETSSGSTIHYYLVAEHGRARIVGVAGERGGLTPIARRVLAALAAKDLDGARRWIDLVAADVGTGGAGASFAPYRAAVAAGPAGRDVLELTAALMLVDSDYPAAAPILRRCAVTGDATQALCGRTLRAEAMRGQRWADVVALTATPPADPAEAKAATTERALALAYQGKFADADAALAPLLAAAPDDALVQRVHLELAVGGHPWADAAPVARQLAALPAATSMDLNDVAWSLLYAGNDVAGAAEIGRRAEALVKRPDHGLGNTLAAIEVEQDHLVAGWQRLEKVMPGDPQVAPLPSEWFVIGRIAERCGLRDDAIAAYRRVGTEGHASLLPSSVGQARAALARLGARP